LEGTQSGLRTVLGLDIGGTERACVEGTAGAEILQRVEIPTNAAQPFSATFLESARGEAELMAKQQVAPALPSIPLLGT
jgi:predicted NBD/HSP70 family sugar kinase